MFLVDLNQHTNTIQVKVNNNDDNSTIIAEGNFAVDKPDHTVLISFNHVQIALDNQQELGQFISIIFSHVNKLGKSLICLRLPSIFDNHIDRNISGLKNENNSFMSVISDDIKYYSENNLFDKQDQYELITDRETTLKYAESLVKLMNKNAFWSTNWDLEEIRSRINSTTKSAMILDKINNVSCGFGRLLLLKTNDKILGYISDIAIDGNHQSKGLGRVIINYLVGISISEEMKECSKNVTLCLQCADRGSGAISAPKLYRRSGFEYVNDIGHRIAIFASSQEDTVQNDN